MMARHGWLEEEIPDYTGDMGGAVIFQFTDGRGGRTRKASAIWSDYGFVNGYFFGPDGPPLNPDYFDDDIQFAFEAISGDEATPQ